MISFSCGLGQKPSCLYEIFHIIILCLCMSGVIELDEDDGENPKG